MKIIQTVSGMKALRSKLTSPLGFVPTMGYLHEGHLSLVRQAKLENATVVVSIFINPTQFGPEEDYALYPRDEERDIDLLRKEKTDILFLPPPDEMYPPSFDTWVKVRGVTEKLEGVFRPGHFQGVTTILTKLFNIVEPKRAYFGQKDAQQAIVVKKMVAELNMSLEISVLPTIREPDGLAMSSRNTYLNPEERQAATVLFRSLTFVHDRYMNGERDAEALRRQMISLITKEPLAKIDYVSIADQETLEELSTINRPALASLAVKIVKVRLIDNVQLG